MGYDEALAYARERGAEKGRDAAAWVEVADAAAAKRLIRGIEDGDPEVLDGLPAPDLSGEWADGLTGPQLVESAVWHATSGHSEVDNQPEADWFSDICEAYEAAYSKAVEAEVTRRARYQL